MTDPSRARSLTRRVGRAALWAFAALGLYFVITLVQVWWVGRSTHTGPVDAIVVLGAAQYDGTPSPQLRGRLDRAIELFDEGAAPVVVVTGGKQPLDRFTEAEASAAYLVEHGVPVDAILQEPVGRTTFGSLENARRVTNASRFAIERVLLVTDPFHAYRSRLIADSVGFDAEVAPTDASSGFGRYVGEAGGVAAGRIIGFGRLAELTD